VTLDGQGNPVGPNRVLFTAPRFEDLQVEPENVLFDVMPDGEHFVFLLEQSSSPMHYNVVLNWTEELKANSQVR